MKVLEWKRPLSNSFTIEVTCGEKTLNHGSGCSSQLEINQNDCYKIQKQSENQLMTAHGFICPVCGQENIIPFEENRSLLNKSEWLFRRKDSIIKELIQLNSSKQTIDFLTNEIELSEEALAKYFN